MEYGIESFTGIRPTADLTVANYLGAIQPILEDEAANQATPDAPESASAVFLAELHAATTHAPRDVHAYSHELARTLMASGVQGEIYSQRAVADLVGRAEISVRGLTTVARILRLPTLKDKVTGSDNVETATVALASYPLMMAADIILARPGEVPTGKDQKSHLEITNELIRAFNREHGAQLPEPRMREVELPNIMSLDGSGRKMSKSYPGGAIFLDRAPSEGAKKIMKTVTASQPGPAMDAAVANLMQIAEGLASNGHQTDLGELRAIAAKVREGAPQMGSLKRGVGEIVVGFLADIQERRDSISDAEVTARVAHGSEWFRPIGEATLRHMDDAFWGVAK